MKRLFRDRKLSIDSKSKPSVSAPAPLASADTPLYSRFASANRGQDNGGPSAKPTVSGPKHLSAKTSFSRRSVGGVPTTNAKSREAERHSKVISRMPSGTREEEVKPEVNPSFPNRHSFRAEPAVVKVSPTQSEPHPARTNGNAYRMEFPRVRALNTADSAVIPPEVDLSQPQRWRADSQSSDGSNSSSYSPPRRTLVVRNQDPESDSLADIPSSPPPPSQYHTVQYSPSVPSLQRTLDVSSPTSQYARLLHTGFDLSETHYSEVTTSDPHLSTSRRPPGSVTSPAFSHQLNSPATNVQQHRRSFTPATHGQSEQSAVVPSVPSQQQIEHSQTHSPGIVTAHRRPSLLSISGVTRKKYSPLAAFGLPVSQVNSMSSAFTSTSSSNAQTDSVSIIHVYYVVCYARLALSWHQNVSIPPGEVRSVFDSLWNGVCSVAHEEIPITI